MKPAPTPWAARCMLLLAWQFSTFQLEAQKAAIDPNPNQDSIFIEQIYTTSLTQGIAYDELKTFLSNAPKRSPGSKSLEVAIDRSVALFKKYGADTVWKQPVHCERWQIGDASEVYMNSEIRLENVPLGHCPATPDLGITAKVLMVNSLDELEKIPALTAKGKIVFFNGKFPNDKEDRFLTYAEIYAQRAYGAQLAAQKGAIGSITRSLSSVHDDVPHAGGTYFKDVVPIPALSIGWLSADKLEADVLAGRSPELFIRTYCHTWPEGCWSNNVIAEIRGSEFPNEVITVGGHIDSWNNTPGAHDDAGGCMATLDILHLFKTLNYRPKRTIRFVFWVAEEMGGYGADAYAQFAKNEKKQHVACLESDRGVYYPLGFYLNSKKDLERQYVEKFSKLEPLLKNKNLNLTLGEAGDDAEPMREMGTALLSLNTNSLYYFDLHHTVKDVFEQVKPEEIALCSASMATIVFLIDHFGL